MVRAAAKNHPERRDRHVAGAVRRGAGRAGRRRFTLIQRNGWPPTPSSTRRPTTCGGQLVRQRAGRHPDGPSSRPGRRAWSGRPSAVRREPAPAGRALSRGLGPSPGWRRPSSWAARRCPTTTTSTRRRPGVRRTTSPSRRRDHQARQPVRHRRRCRRRRGAPQGARVRPGVRVRWRDRRQPPGLGGAGRADRRDLHRGHRRARRTRTARSRSCQGKKNLRVLECAALRRGGAEPRAITGGVLVQQRDASTPRVTTRRTGRWPPGRRLATRCSPTSRSPGGPAAR